MHCHLACIQQNRNTFVVRQLDDFMDGCDGAEGIRHHGDRHNLRPRRQQLAIFIQQKIAIVINRRPFQNSAPALPVKMPRHNVGVVFEDGENNLITLPDLHAAIRLRHQIDGLGCIAGEDDLVFRRCIDKPPHRFARVLECLGCRVGQVMQSAMHIGIFPGQALQHGIDNNLRLLCRSSVVEINQRLAINLAGEDGKVSADFLNIIHFLFRHSMQAEAKRRRDMEPRFGAMCTAARKRGSKSPAIGRSFGMTGIRGTFFIPASPPPCPSAPRATLHSPRSQTPPPQRLAPACCALQLPECRAI